MDLLIVEYNFRELALFEFKTECICDVIILVSL